jgi:hypothetical protein
LQDFPGGLHKCLQIGCPDSIIFRLIEKGADVNETAIYDRKGQSVHINICFQAMLIDRMSLAKELLSKYPVVLTHTIEVSYAKSR